MSEVQIDPPNNLQSGGKTEESIQPIQLFASNILDTLKEYKYEILLGFIILGVIVVKLWVNPYFIQQYFKKEK